MAVPAIVIPEAVDPPRPVRAPRAPRAPRRQIDLGVSEDGTITVTRTLYGHESDRVDTVRVPQFPVPPARVRIEGSATRNLGDYNSVRVAVTIEMPCLPVQEEIERVYGMTSGWVDHLLGVELSNAVAASAPATTTPN